MGLLITTSRCFHFLGVGGLRHVHGCIHLHIEGLATAMRLSSLTKILNLHTFAFTPIYNARIELGYV
jgi:hypothetical protein